MINSPVPAAFGVPVRNAVPIPVPGVNSKDSPNPKSGENIFVIGTLVENTVAARNTLELGSTGTPA
jgi:hypothetical protein